MTTGTPASLPLVGLDAYSLTGPSGREICENDTLSLLRAAKSLGADGLQAGLPDDAGRREEAFDLAEELGLYLEPYVPLPLHWRNDQAEIERRERRFHEICAAASRRGIRALHCAMGARERFEDLGRWTEYVAATARCLIRLGPELRDWGVCVGLENHWDFSTYEILRIVEQAGADVVGFGLDTGNLPILAEAPDRAVARAAHFTVTAHLKDAMLYTTARGAVRPVMPIGAGQMSLGEAVRELYRHNPGLRFTIEDHPVIYPVDYFETWWLEAVPELTSHDIAATARLAHEGDGWLAEHRVADPPAVEVIPWSVRGPARLRADIAAVREMLTAAGAPVQGQDTAGAARAKQ
jgi:sugar phosphate isomerase/epimerase